MKESLLKDAINGFRWNTMRRKSVLPELNLICKRFSATAIAFGQSYEDIIIEKMTRNIQGGVYVDIGANHPIFVSNTYLLYLKGWHGINVDPMPKCKKEFDRFRPKDINLCLGVGSRKENMTYYSFKESCYNTFNPKQAKSVQGQGAHLISEQKVPVDTLENIFDKYLSMVGNKIDVMTLDVETMELDVLSSNNWEKYRPKYIIMESLGSKDDIESVFKDPAVAYLLERGYIVENRVFQSVFLKDRSK